MEKITDPNVLKSPDELKIKIIGFLYYRKKATKTRD
jgi:hypothetical protein